MATSTAPGRRARHAFWILVLIASLAVGVLSSGLSGHPSPLTGLLVATSGAVGLISLTLAARVMIAIDRARRGAGDRKA